MPLRALVAPQQFKGTLSARKAADAIAKGVRLAAADAVLDLAPLADGGQGTVDALVLSREGGEVRTTKVQGPLGAPVTARWGFLPDDKKKGPWGVIEMASASGLLLVPQPERKVLDASTFGVGQLIRAALDAGCTRIAVGAGDSGTCDGGLGAATALGARFLDAKGQELPPGPRHLRRLERVELDGVDARLKTTRLQVLTDVLNPLLGEMGTAHVFGPQKGADGDEVEHLESAMQHLSLVVARQLGRELASEQGAGAAGGLAFGLAAFCGATITRGFDAVSEALGLFQRITEVDVVFTGEGQIDTQTTGGKGPWSLGRLARMQKKRVVAFAGKVLGGNSTQAREAFDDVIAVSPPGSAVPSPEEAEALLVEAARSWAARYRPA